MRTKRKQDRPGPYSVPVHTRLDRETDRLLTARAVSRGVTKTELLRTMVLEGLRLPACSEAERVVVETSFVVAELCFALAERMYGPEMTAEIRRVVEPRARNRAAALAAAADERAWEGL